MMTRILGFHYLMLLALCVHTCDAFLNSFSSKQRASVLRMGIEEGKTNVTIIEKKAQPERQDDTSDRFRYKVHALMGDFDPPTEMDTENETGNILGAMLTFPTSYRFNAVGKTNGDAAIEERFVERMVHLVSDTCGEDGLTFDVTPRGSKFTKVSVQATVESATMISAVYDELKNEETCVMQF